MILADYSTVDRALKGLRLQGRIRHFAQPIPHTVCPDLSDRIDLVRQLGFVNNEFAAAEGLVFPVLLEVWLRYQNELTVRSPVTFATEGLKDRPGYAVSRVALRGQMGFQPPYAVIVVAKKDDFDEGWGQCLAAMTASRQLNRHPELPVWGAVTTGHVWQLGKLEGTLFTQDWQLFDLANLARLCGALRYVFEQIKAYPLAPPDAAPSAA